MKIITSHHPLTIYLIKSLSLHPPLSLESLRYIGIFISKLRKHSNANFSITSRYLPINSVSSLVSLLSFRAYINVHLYIYNTSVRTDVHVICLFFICYVSVSLSRHIIICCFSYTMLLFQFCR